MSVLRNLNNEFILHLVKTLEAKVYFGLRKYRREGLIAFPPFEFKNLCLALLRLKPAVFYEISKAGSSIEKMMLFLNYGGGVVTWLRMTYDDIAFKYLTRRIKEGSRLFLSIKLCDIEFSPKDFPHSWEDGGLVNMLRRWCDPFAV